MKTKKEHIEFLEQKFKNPSMAGHSHPNQTPRWERFLIRYMNTHGLSKEALAKGKFHKPWEERHGAD